MSKITTQIRPISECSLKEQKECYHLLLAEFAGIRWDEFIRDFNEKEHVILLIGPEEKIVGFSTIMIIDLQVEEKIVKAIFSGDTTVHRAHRDSVGFAVEFAKFFVKTIEMFPAQEIYYVLISKGWRTYRILPFYFKHFVPHHGTSITSYEQSVMDAFGYKKYPHNYNASTGLLMFDGDVQRLKPESIDALPMSRNDFHGQFFISKNPEYLRGNELVCIAQVAYDNFTNAITRFAGLSNRKEAV